MSVAASVTSDPRVEKILKRNDLTYKLTNIPVEEVNRYENSQARLGDLDKFYINRYVQALKNGAQFPPIVVYKNGKDGYTSVDGNHRVEATKKDGKKETIRAYVIQEVITPEVAVYIGGVINVTAHGKPVVTKQEITRLILAAVDNPHNWPDEHIGQELGVSRTKVRNVRIGQKAKSRLSSLGIEFQDVPDISESTLRDLHNKIADDEVYKQAVSLVSDATLTGDDVTALTHGIQRLGTEEARLEFVQKERDAREEDIRAKGEVYTIPAEIIRTISGLKKVIQRYPEPEKWSPLNTIKRQEFLGTVRDEVIFLGQVQTNLEKTIKDETIFVNPNKVNIDDIEDEDAE